MKLIINLIQLINYLKFIVVKFNYRLNPHQGLGVDPNRGVFTVSLTTYSKRIHDVHLTIESIFRQKSKAKEIILWLDKDEFNEKTIPTLIKKQITKGLIVKYTSNMKSYKKLIPTLLEDKLRNVVTIDDDVIYPARMLDIFRHKMLETNGKEVLSFRCHEMAIRNDGKIDKYDHWCFNLKKEKSSMKIFPTGVGGVLYPQGVLHSDVVNFELANQLCPTADDVWFKVMTLKAGGFSRNINYSFIDRLFFINIPSSQDIALYNFNQEDEGNDKCLLNVFDYYDIKF